MNNTLLKLCGFFVLFFNPYHAHSMTEADLNVAAKAFIERCSSCHGRDALGEGIITLQANNYSSTNIYANRKYNSQTELVAVIRYGLMVTSETYMPPWEGEPDIKMINLLADFTIFLRENLNDAGRYLKAAVDHSDDVSNNGKFIFETRCQLCHGPTGMGDGRMVKVIKNPPPTNFQKSTVTMEYIRLIVKHGGEVVKRSPQMPPWGDQLSEKEIEAVAKYVYEFRQSN